MQTADKNTSPGNARPSPGTMRLLKNKLRIRTRLRSKLRKCLHLWPYHKTNSAIDPDEPIKQLFARKIFGIKKISRHVISSDEWKQIENSTSYNFPHHPLSCMTDPLINLTPYHYSIKFNGDINAAARIYRDQRFDYQQKSINILADSGDVVVDLGDSKGESTLYFSHRVGKNGKVYSLHTSDPALLEHNINYNPNLSGNITVVKSLNGIDAMMEERNVTDVQLIKIDMGKDTLQAIHQAAHTLKSFKPILMIAVQPNSQAYADIFSSLKDLSLKYKFYEKKNTALDEVVVFAVPKR